MPVSQDASPRLIPLVIGRLAPGFSWGFLTIAGSPTPCTMPVTSQAGSPTKRIQHSPSTFNILRKGADQLIILNFMVYLNLKPYICIT